MALEFSLKVRCVGTDYNAFRKWCETINKEPCDVIREVMKAAPEGRLNITMTKEQKKHTKELYK